ncbi:hypothetical protein A2803_05360 [Candidatus Woesebacteria bacterium RIFCSPHIGHO2_01_FULL_44_21]|uniref:Uncharacterized protein n=1 Tax=Candidatus Woesebacteria bacterium RIFCSPHIGHO2_01_FULL_44_21 TaxID=1802503 RepID=A0A1F7YUR8_9BACT|nr:MAG: hypothetical protein A2803_05360 [Candidatus Woesebacteria bacterium RIFCSPHIGHO2_01_FULL_44_21]OGM68794.1 MAG: hypothetical protein A2897_01335 [Candidatus Woesebacteria bacterium RIFCSPLOWO2_01_FULL_44_24b]
MANELSEIITPPKERRNFFTKKNILGLLLIIFLIAGIGVGLVLLNREQDIRGRAATIDQGSANNLSGCSADIDPIARESCSSFCTNSGCTLPGGLASGRCEIRRFHSNQNNDQVVNDTQTGFTNNGGANMGFSQTCGAEQIDVGCYTDELNNDGVYNDGFKTVANAWRRYSESCGGAPAPTSTSPSSTNPPTGGGGVPQCGCYGSGECVDKPNNEGPTHPAGECIMDNDKGYCVWDPGRCASGGGGDTSTPKPGLCDDSCNSDDDCADMRNGAILKCNTTIKKCVNMLCPNDTIPRNNCDCRTPVQTCGEPCGGGYPLCGAGFSCAYIVGPSCTTSSTVKPTSYCMPSPIPSGYSLPKCVARDQFNSYIKRVSDGKSSWTQAEIIQTFCQPAATPTATPAVATSITAQCLAIKIYDQNWDNLTVAEFSQLKPGSIVRFSAGGTTTGGQFEAARFTVNGVQRPEVTSKAPGKEELYDEYTIPEGVLSFTIGVQLRHSSLGWF